MLIAAALVLIAWGVREITPQSIPHPESIPDSAATSTARTGYQKYNERYPKKQYPTKTQKTYPKIEINSADSATLTLIRGIGPTFARRIVTYRQRLGGFYDINQLLEIKGLDSVKLQEIISQIKLDTTLCQKFSLTHCPTQSITNHPYISHSLSKRILKHRASLEQLIQNDIILPSEAKKLKQYFF